MEMPWNRILRIDPEAILLSSSSFFGLQLMQLRSRIPFSAYLLHARMQSRFARADDVTSDPSKPPPKQEIFQKAEAPLEGPWKGAKVD